MTSSTTTEIREHISAATFDIGCSRAWLRELDAAGPQPGVESASRQDIATWLNQAATALQRAACIAELGN